MVAFRWISTFVGREGSGMMAGLSDMLLVDRPEGRFLLTVNGEGGGMQVLSVGARTLTGVQDLRFEGQNEKAGLNAPRQLAEIKMEGLSGIAVSGVYRPYVLGTAFNTSGDVSTGILLPFEMLRQRGSNQIFSAMTEMVSLEMGGKTMLVMASRTGDGLSVWKVIDGYRLDRVLQGSDVNAITANDIAAMTLYTGPQGPEVLALSHSQKALLRYQVQSDGQLRLLDKVVAADGLYIGGPSVVQIARIGGQDYAIVGATKSASLSVVALHGDGKTTVVDHVIDTTRSRFDGASILEVIEIGGQVFLLVAGSEEALSLLTLLPGGRLLYLTDIADDLSMGLRNIADIETYISGSTIEIFIAGLMPEAFEGNAITRLRLDLGTMGIVVTQGQGAVAGVVQGTAGRDVLQAGATGVRIEGGAGDDILMDGAGSDRMYGGDGADIFVLTRDGATDYILDFEIGIDRMDLSGLLGSYSLDAMDFRSTPTGAEIRINNELLVIETRSKTPLLKENMHFSDFLDLPHYPYTPPAPSQAPPVDPDPPTPPGLTPIPVPRNLPEIRGGSGADLLAGNRQSQRLIGLEGDDTLVGSDYNATAMQVFRLYQAALARAPDDGGQFRWTRAIETGTRTLAEAAAGFVESHEFRQRFGDVDDRAFVTLLYRNVLDRGPDTGGMQTWLNALKNGWTRAEVLVGFSESVEFRNKVMPAALMTLVEGHQQTLIPEVFRLYRAVLGRNPDMGGLLDWTKALAEGAEYLTVVKSFINSVEFQTTYSNLSTSEFVTLLYRNVLGRAPDASGFATWANAIANGMSREQVVGGFANSTEFIRSSAAAVNAWGKARFTADDELHGGAGHNVLFGGLGRDTFVFEAKDKGYNLIAGFEIWDDLILKGFGFTAISDFQASLTVVGSDVSFTNQGTTILFKNTDLATVLGSDLYLI